MYVPKPSFRPSLQFPTEDLTLCISIVNFPPVFCVRSGLAREVCASTAPSATAKPIHCITKIHSPPGPTGGVKRRSTSSRRRRGAEGVRPGCAPTQRMPSTRLGQLRGPCTEEMRYSWCLGPVSFTGSFQGYALLRTHTSLPW